MNKKTKDNSKTKIEDKSSSNHNKREKEEEEEAKREEEEEERKKVFGQIKIFVLSRRKHTGIYTQAKKKEKER